LNEKIIQPEDIEEFIEFLNNLKSPLTSIRGIGDQYAKLIVDKRPYTSKQDMQKKLGAKRSLNWVRAYKEAKI
jgi:DNA polymerase III alpha subunit (gram-positive type)